jgi:hypothetical protein
MPVVDFKSFGDSRLFCGDVVDSMGQVKVLMLAIAPLAQPTLAWRECRKKAFAPPMVFVGK